MPHTRKELLSWAKDTWEKIIGKHQNHEEVTIKGWVVRNKYGTLFVFEEKPEKYIKHGCWLGYSPLFIQEDLPSVQWSDPEPTPATITIKIEK